MDTISNQQINFRDYKLTIEQQEEIVRDYFGFSIENGIIYDEYGDVFHLKAENHKFDLTTIGGIIHYTHCRGYNNGKVDGSRETILGA